MRLGNLIFSAIEFLITVIVLLSGLFFLMLEKAPDVQIKISQFFLEREDCFLLIGILLVGIGTVLLFSFYAMSRKTYYQVKMGQYPMEIDAQLIEQILENYWLKKFKGNQIETAVKVFHDQTLEIVLKTKVLFRNEELKQIEKEVGKLLRTSLGYQTFFLLTVLN